MRGQRLLAAAVASQQPHGACLFANHTKGCRAVSRPSVCAGSILLHASFEDAPICLAPCIPLAAAYSPPRRAQDFAVEQDEQCMRKAAHLMVSSLAGQLALVTCREPMRVSLLEMLRSLLQPALEPVALEHAATVRPKGY